MNSQLTLNPFRERHLLKAYHLYLNQHLPLDLFLSNYFRENKAIGSKDRAFISDALFGIVRWQGLLDAYLLDSHPNQIEEKRVRLFLSKTISELQQEKELPPHEKESFPFWLFKKLESSYGLNEAINIAANSNKKAPRAVRANLLKTTRDNLFNELSQKHSVSKSNFIDTALIFNEKTNYIEIPSFKEGFFEIQDEGSQLLANLLPVKPLDHVLDFCSGSGGKALAIAPKMEGKGQLYLHDIRPLALQEARKRLNRAKIQNAQFILAKDPRLSKLKKRMDAIIVDAPCSGTGTLRRNPDMKWKLKEESILSLIEEQREIFKQALLYLKPTGFILYGTCSLLREENEAQVEYFLKTHQLELAAPLLKTTPTEGGPDGFFGALFKLPSESSKAHKSHLA